MNCIDNFIDGNLTDAKAMAKRYSRPAIRRCLVNQYGRSLEAATAITDYLKDGGSFQAACNAELADHKQRISNALTELLNKTV